MYSLKVCIRYICWFVLRAYDHVLLTLRNIVSSCFVFYCVGFHLLVSFRFSLFLAIVHRLCRFCIVLYCCCFNFHGFCWGLFFNVIVSQRKNTSKQIKNSAMVVCIKFWLKKKNKKTREKFLCAVSLTGGPLKWLDRLLALKCL